MRIRLCGALVGAVLLLAVAGPDQGGPLSAIARALSTPGQLSAPGRAHAALAPDASAPPTGGDYFAPELGLPATEVVAIGSGPQEAPGEVWAYGKLGDVPVTLDGHSYSDQYALLERSDASGWQVVPLPLAANATPLVGAPYRGATPSEHGPFAGQTTAAGGVVLVFGQTVVTRDPGAKPQLAPAPSPIGTPPPGGAGSPGDGVLAEGESLLGEGAAAGPDPPYAAIEEDGAHTGVLIAPHDDGGNPGGKPKSPPGVLHFDGRRWSREPIALTTLQEDGFNVLALACAGSPASGGPGAPSCWLLASSRLTAVSGQPTSLALFRRVPSAGSAGYVWQPQPVGDGPLSTEGAPNAPTVAALSQGAQMLTATTQGAWVDFQAQINASAAGGASTPSYVSEFLSAPPVPVSSGEPAPAETPPSPVPLPPASVLGAWCFPTGAGCPDSLGMALPGQYRSFAWPGGSGDPGIRLLTGLPAHALLEFAAGGVSQVVGAGGTLEGTAAGGAAFSSPQRGLLADGSSSQNGADQQGQAQVIAVGTQPGDDQLQQESVPFRRPLLALAQAPGSTPGSSGAQAIAVGDEGQIARYVPGQGWAQESLYDSAGKVQSPTLRGVAWPEPGRAYALGDNGAMWVWQAATGLWEPDPAKPLNFIGNLSAVAFSSTHPGLGYAVGKQGVLLRFGKSWTQVSLPPELSQANFTSVSFAGGEAIAAYRIVQGATQSESGGIAVEDGSGWRVDPGAAALLSGLPTSTGAVLSKAAGLPDGGAVAAGPGLVIERDSASAPWRFSAQPLPEAQNVSALAAYRDPAGAVRAIVSLDLDLNLDPNADAGGSFQFGPWGGDMPPPTSPGEPPAFISPDPLPNSGYLVKETAGGWSDMQHQAYPATSGRFVDSPLRPDPVLALIVAPGGESGLAVGGQTGDFQGTGAEPTYETAAAMRFPGAGGASAGGDSPAAVGTTAGHASFVVAGQASCMTACGALINEGPGPDVWMAHALESADWIASGSGGGLRAFLYTGSVGGEDVFPREAALYRGSLPAYAPGSVTSTAGGASYYAFRATGAEGGPVEVIVLAFAGTRLEQEPAQEQWLKGQLEAAKQQGLPAIVMGNASLGFSLPQQNPGNIAADSEAVAALLLQGGASAYFFDFPEANVSTIVSYGGSSIPAFGTGTLGYVNPPTAFEADSLGSSGFLLADVDTSARNPLSNVAPVSARVVPNISRLALDATDGVLLRRSQVALFEALARRPPGGGLIGPGGNGTRFYGPDPYDQIPFFCQGSNCPYQVPTDYAFSSSNPDIGDFVAHDPTSSNPRQVKLGADGLPVPDPSSGLFCAFNSGTTTVSIATGGLTYAERVSVQGGSVEYPCGTVPLRNPPAPAKTETGFPAPDLPSAASPAPTGPQLRGLVPPPPPAVVRAHPRPVTPPPAPPFLALSPPPLGARPAIVPPPAPPAGRPIPPSGSSQVYQSMGAPEEKREEESATELASSNFAAYDANQRSGPGPWVLILVVLAAAGGVGLRGGARRTSRPRAAPSWARVGER